MKDTHVLQLVADGFLENFFKNITDEEINACIKRGNFAYDPNYYTKGNAFLLTRQQPTGLADLAEEARALVEWKLQWCRRFLRAQAESEKGARITKAPASLASFIQSHKTDVAAWFNGYCRGQGIDDRDQPRIIERYADGSPSASSLKNWLKLLSDGKGDPSALRQNYHRCGNRNQVDPRARAALAEAVDSYCSSLKPSMADVYEDLEGVLEALSTHEAAGNEIYVSSRALRRRIHRLDAFAKDLGRNGPKYAALKYTQVGRGIARRVKRPLERVEMDDWEMDLQVLLVKAGVWKRMSPTQRKNVPRCRCTVTAAIDVATRCIVGLSVSPNSPSTQTACDGLATIYVDKTNVAKSCGATSDWPMFGRVETVVTDGGTAFSDAFESRVAQCLAHRQLPDQDPRMRGTIESFFRQLKRFCRYFAGRTFANVVERGDYESEALASVTVEDIERHLVRYVVDVYHHRRHRGLRGLTPYTAWTEATSQYGLRPSLSEAQLLLALGDKIGTRSIDKSGISVKTRFYIGDELQDLHKIIGNIPVDIIVRDNHIDAVLVSVPQRVRDSASWKHGHFIVARHRASLENGYNARSFLAEEDRLKRLSEESDRAGRGHRLAAHQELNDIGSRARASAGHPSPIPDADQVRTVELGMRQKLRAASSQVDFGRHATATGSEQLGVVAATAANPANGRIDPNKTSAGQTIVAMPSEVPKPRSKPFGGSMNMIEDDSE